MPRTNVRIESLLAATDIDVLPDGAIIEDRDSYVVVRSPSNPQHYWGNFLLLRVALAVGGREHWERVFEREFAAQPLSDHVAIGVDRIGEEHDAAALEEFVSAGYDLDEAVALIATPQELVAHPRANAEVEIRMLDPAPGADADLWHSVAELQVANRDPAHQEADHRAFATRRLVDRRERFARGEGGWFVALTPQGELAASCGVMVTERRARYQAVDTATEFRRRGIATRLVHDVGCVAIERFGADHLVIGADPSYHALALYESLGFIERERATAVTWWPRSPKAALHPTRGRLAGEPG